MGNLLKLIPSLKEKIPTLDSLLPILSEQAPSQNTKNALTTVAVPHLRQSPPHELVPPPVLVPKLQLEKPPTTISIPYHASHKIRCLQLQLITNPNHYHWKCLTMPPPT